MRKILVLIAALSTLVAGAFLWAGPASAQDERLDARPGDFRVDGEIDIVSYLSAGSVLADAPPIVPGQEVELTVEGFASGDAVTVFIANPVTSLGVYEVGDDGLTVTVTIPDDFREGYAEIVASAGGEGTDLLDRDLAVSVAAVYVTADGVEVSTDALDVAMEDEQLITFTTASLADTGRETLTYLGLGVVLLLAGAIFMDSTRKRSLA